MRFAVNNRRKNLWRFLVTLSGLTLVWYALDARKSLRRDIIQLEGQITTDLPVGTHRDSVEKWLSTGGWERGWGASTLGVQRNGRVTAIGAFVHRWYFWYGSGDLLLWFEFDDNGRLSQFSVIWDSDAP